MPLQRASGTFTLDPDRLTRILFPMTDGEKPVTGFIDCDALVDTWGEPGADPLLVFRNNRSAVEKLASDKYDAQGGGGDIVELTDDDFEEI
jgi:hypothetical protein